MTRALDDGHRPGSAVLAAWQRHGAACYGLARQVTGDDTLAEQATGRALAAWRSQPGSQPGGGDGRGSPRGQLMDLAHRAAVTLARRHGTRRDPATARHALDEERTVAAWPALTGLPPAQRQVLALAWAGGYTTQEIAQATGTPQPVVQASLLAALRHLHRHLPKPSGGEPLWPHELWPQDL